MNIFKHVIYILIIIGAINWGFIAYNFNLVEWLFGQGLFTRIVYLLVGLSGLIGLICSIKMHIDGSYKKMNNHKK